MTTVNRKLSAVSGLYVFHARHGVDLGGLVTELEPVRARRTGRKPFLYHLAGGQPERRRTIKPKTPRTHPTLPCYDALKPPTPVFGASPRRTSDFASNSPAHSANNAPRQLAPANPKLAQASLSMVT